MVCVRDSEGWRAASGEKRLRKPVDAILNRIDGWHSIMAITLKVAG